MTSTTPDPSARTRARVRRLGFACAVLAIFLASTFAVTVGARAGEADAGARDAGSEAGPDPTQPDPPPLRERFQWTLDLRYAKGDVYLLGIQRVDLGTPQTTPRVMGRFALELFEGPALLERVRFDFPFLGEVKGERDGGYFAAPGFDKITSRIGVRFPATPRGRRFELVDRATGRRWPLPWPLTETAADAGP